MLFRLQGTHSGLQTLTAVLDAQKNAVELLGLELSPGRVLPLETVQEQREERRVQTED